MPEGRGIHAGYVMNLLARSIHVLTGYLDKTGTNAARLSSISGHETMSQTNREQYEKYFSDETKLLNELRREMDAIEAMAEPNQQAVCAETFCRLLDEKITYDSPSRPGIQSRHLFSVRALVHPNVSPPFHISSMNTNVRETGIWINPRLDTAGLYRPSSDSAGSRIKGHNTYSLGLNGMLTHVSFVRWSEGIEIDNVIINNRLHPGKQRYRVAFAPLGSDDTIIDSDCFDTELCGSSRKVVSYFVKEACREALLQRLKRDILHAAANDVDLLFFPEGLGTALSNRSTRTGPGFVNHFIDEIRKENKGTLPEIVVLPSWIRDGINAASLVHSSAWVLGEQRKYFPAVENRNHREEYLLDAPQKTFLVIHVAGVHRICVMICAEYLDDESRAFVSQNLLPTLVLVPSYTHGEQEFLNSLPTMKPTGTTTVWGTYCGAPFRKEERTIGGCSIYGYSADSYFCDAAPLACGLRCSPDASCLFTVDLPLNSALLPRAEGNPVRIHHIFSPPEAKETNYDD